AVPLAAAGLGNAHLNSTLRGSGCGGRQPLTAPKRSTIITVSPRSALGGVKNSGPNLIELYAAPGVGTEVSVRGRLKLIIAGSNPDSATQPLGQSASLVQTARAVSSGGHHGQEQPSAERRTGDRRLPDPPECALRLRALRARQY